jgi:hypothetical protein
VTPLHDAVRDAVQTLADRGRTVNLGTAALALAHRRRTVRIWVTATVVVVLVATFVPIGTATWRRHVPMPPTESVHPAPPTEDIQLTRDAPLIVEGLRLVQYSDRRTSSEGTEFNRRVLLGGKYYADTPWITAAAIGPSNTVAAIQRPEAGIVDPTTGRLATTWNLQGYEPHSVHWSPDGRKVLLGITEHPVGSGRPSKVGFAIVDVASGRVDSHLFAATAYLADWSFVSWHPSGDRIVLPLLVPRQGEPPKGLGVSALQLFDLAGKPAEVVDLPALVLGPAAWSPDRHHVIGLVDGDATVRSLQLFDGPPWRAGPRLETTEGAWWIDNDRLLVANRKRGTADLMLDVRDRSGQVLRSLRLEGPSRAVITDLSFLPAG